MWASFVDFNLYKSFDCMKNLLRNFVYLMQILDWCIICSVYAVASMLDKEYPDNDTAVSEIALIECLLIVGQRCADSQRKQHEHI